MILFKEKRKIHFNTQHKLQNLFFLTF